MLSRQSLVSTDGRNQHNAASGALILHLSRSQLGAEVSADHLERVLSQLPGT
jgi:hypothetical protein